MASRYRSLSNSTFSILKSAAKKPTRKPQSLHSLLSTHSSVTISRSVPQLVALQSLFPLHSTVAAARLTSCLGIDSRSSRSLSQELGLSVPR
uniref:Uncharacterized protein n=1 Tax=Rhizophora mucronata TaxID=61149 RepID=A0A2P2JII3_RHIMU